MVPTLTVETEVVPTLTVETEVVPMLTVETEVVPTLTVEGEGATGVVGVGPVTGAITMMTGLVTGRMAGEGGRATHHRALRVQMKAPEQWRNRMTGW